MTDARPPWAVVEVLGHRTYVGQIEPIEILGVEMLRVHVPERVEDHTEYHPADRLTRTVTQTTPAFVVDVARHSLHTITHCSEATARAWMNRCERGPQDSIRVEGPWVARPEPPPAPADTDDIPF